MYDNKTEKGGRPNIDEIIMIKILILQELNNSLQEIVLSTIKGDFKHNFNKYKY